MSWAVDIVLDGSGSIAVLGPFRSERRARQLVERIERACAKSGITSYYPTVTDLENPAEWRRFVDLTP